MKNRKLTRILALILAMLMCASVLTGCAKEEAQAPADESAPSATPETDAPEAEAPAEEEASSEPVTLKWYVAGNAPQADIATVQQAMSDYVNETYGLNINLDIICTDFGSYSDKMQMVIAGGEEYDICWTSSWCNNYFTNVNKNAFIPLDDLIAEYGQELYASIPEGVWDGTRVNGTLYAVPSYQVECKQNIAVIPQKYVDEFGLDVSSVKDIADLEEFLYQVKEAYPDLYPMACSSSGLVNKLGLDLGYEEIVGYNVPGVLKMYDETLTVYNQFEQEEFIDFWKMLYRWAQDGIIRMDAATVQEDAVPDTKAGLHACRVDATYVPDCETTKYYGEFGNQDCVVIPLSDAYAATSATVATLNAISQTSKHPELAMQFLNILNTDATLYNMICFGIEDVHYTKNADGTVSSIGGAGYDPNTDWVFANQFLAYPRAGQSADIWEKSKEYSDAAKTSCAMGFSFDASNVQTEIAAVSAVVDQYFIPMDTGALDPETAIPELLAKLEAAGCDVILSEMQSQINAWMETK